MTGNLREYANIGLVHQMIYPDSIASPEEHVRTLAELARRDDIDTFDCCLPFGDEYLAAATRVVNESGKGRIVFATHLFPLRKLSYATPDYAEQAQARILVKEFVRQAVAIHAVGFIFPSCGPSPAEATEAHYISFREFCRWLCSELKPYGIDALLEPFDMTVDKKFLYGPTPECVELIQSLEPEIDNFFVELDMAHLPLMGESFEEAIKTTAPYLKRVHLGNCVMRDKAHPLYGDKHPPIGYPGGEIDVEETAEILRLLLEVGFLDKEKKGDLLIEMTPWPGKTVEETISDNFARLNRAWERVS